MGVEGVEKLNAAGAAIDNTAVKEEKLTRATRTSGDAMGQLLGRLDARVRAERALQNALQQVNRFEEEGIGTAGERAQAINAATMRYNESIQRISGTKAQDTFLGAGNAARLSAFQIQNLSFQLQDVGQAVLTGQPLFRTFIQQGSQIAQIFGPGVGVAGAIRAVGTGVAQFLLNPLNLLVLGFAGAVAGAGALFTLLRGDTTSTVLEKHEDVIKSIKERWEEAEDAAVQYGERAQAAITFEGRQNIVGLQDRADSELLSLRSTLNAIESIARVRRVFGGVGDLGAGPVSEIANRLAEDLRDGTADIQAYNAEVEKLANSDPADKGLQKLAKRFTDLTKEVTSLVEASKEANKQLYELTLLGARTTAAANAREFIGRNAQEAIELRNRQAAALQGVFARSPGEKAAAAAAGVLAAPVDPNESAEGRNLRAQNAAALALATAEHALSEAQRERKRSLDEAMLSAALDLDLLGKSVGATTALRMEYQLTAQLRAEAAKNGTVIDQREIELIKEKTAAIGAYAQQLAEANALRDAQFAREQFGRSPIQQQVAGAVRSIYGDDYAQNLHGAVASQVRLNEQIKLGADLAKDFVGGFASDLQNGVSAVEALGNAFDRLSARLIDMALDQAINMLFANLFGAFGGGTVSAGIGFHAKGNAFDSGNVIPFRRGGVIDRPTLFPMARGMGLMGEDGPEAVMPLKRGADGRLGVEAGGGGVKVEVVNEIVNNNGSEVRTERRRDGNREINRIIIGSVQTGAARGDLDGVLGGRMGARTRVSRTS
ncbi:MAG: hypothetical protein A3E78_11680 [Alphaproteobacteria bacterium RIFCSPHIGHO2_12_FULL_63_12]|nr:MAG: hypothetical protein A3E78_11680 [Alphaproteobacteria bacterium RIFCSPHIGHO2_12_FULL_63_12]